MKVIAKDPKLIEKLQEKGIDLDTLELTGSSGSLLGGFGQQTIKCKDTNGSSYTIIINGTSTEYSWLTNSQRFYPDMNNIQIIPEYTDEKRKTTTPPKKNNSHKNGSLHHTHGGRGSRGKRDGRGGRDD